jgi:hypothetical protein
MIMQIGCRAGHREASERVVSFVLSKGMWGLHDDPLGSAISTSKASFVAHDEQVE